jgi:hypothetical protein
MKTKEENSKIKELILEEYKKGNVVVMTFEGPATLPLDDIISQPTDGLLYDLNRDEATILTFIDNPKWINDYASSAVIRKLKDQIDKYKALLRMANVPELLAEYPHLIDGKEPSKEDIDWAKRVIKEYESKHHDKD